MYLHKYKIKINKQENIIIAQSRKILNIEHLIAKLYNYNGILDQILLIYFLIPDLLIYYKT